MGDTDETIDTGADDTNDTGNDDTSEDTAEDESDTSQNSDDNDASDGAEDGKDDGKGSSDDESDNAEDDTEEDDGSEPELRKPKAGASNKEWAAWRAQEKARKQQQQQKSGESDNQDDGTEESDDDGLSEEERSKLDRRIEKQLAPFKKQQAEQEVNTDIANFLAENPDFKQFESKVRRWALHPNRAGVPVKAIFYEVAGDKLLQIGAKRAQKASQKSNVTKSPKGGSNGNRGEQKSYRDMPLDQFGRELENAKLGR